MTFDRGYAGFLGEAARRWPDRTGLSFEGKTWTYEGLREAASTAAARLAEAGIGSGHRVALLLENSPEYLIAQFALAELGAVFVTPNPYWTVPETVQALTIAGVTTVIHSAQLDPAIKALTHTVGIGALFDGPPTGSAPAADRDAPRYIPFTSGTTGSPKGVVHTDRSLCGGVHQLQRHLGLTAADRLQIALPLCHIFGAAVSAAAISVGAELTLFRRFDLDESLRHLRDTGVTIWPMAGAVAHELVARADLRRKDFASLRYFMWGGSAVPVRLAEQITARTGVGFLCSYGMTEAMTVAFNPVGNPGGWRLDSPGYPTAGTQIRISERGELEVRGPSVAIGYLGGKTSGPNAFLPDGWFRTGDLGTVDTGGRVTIVDRLKDIVKVSGFQVAPTEVEMALTEHPAVADAAVVGAPDERTGERIVAFVVEREPVTADELTRHLAGRLASYKHPREYRFVAQIPRTAGGKVKRAELRG